MTTTHNPSTDLASTLPWNNRVEVRSDSLSPSPAPIRKRVGLSILDTNRINLANSVADSYTSTKRVHLKRSLSDNSYG